MFSLAAIALPSPVLAAQPSEAWVARYDGAGGDDAASAIAVDDSGNVYVTGCSEGDYVTIKYDPCGNEVWVAKYDGPGGRYDAASAIAIDDSGNVYATGCSENDYATIKYDTNGNELWVAPSICINYAIAVAQSGSVYVTGCSKSDYLTTAYDTAGNQLWVARYNGPANIKDMPTAITVDLWENVYVTGESDMMDLPPLVRSDYATIAYNATGNQLWVARYDGPGGGYDAASAIAVDDSGNVYVTGGSWGVGTGEDYATIKYVQYVPPASEVWVDDDYTPDGYNDGHTWGYDAFAKIQDGIDAVASMGTVHVAAGNYYATYEDSVVISRGINVDGEEAAVTILEASGGGNIYVVRFPSGSDGSIEDFTIRGGWNGIYVDNCSPIIRNNVMWDNYKGIVTDHDSASPIITKNIFLDSGIEAVYGSPIITNNLMLRSGIRTYSSSPTIFNNTIAHSFTGILLGAHYALPPSSALIVNNIVAYCERSGIRDVDGDTLLTLSHNNFWNPDAFAGNYEDCVPGTTDISEDPMFLDPAERFDDPTRGDYHLQAGSPCIDAGTNVGAPIEDIEGNPRPIDGDGDTVAISDMGAYEYVPTEPQPPPKVPGITLWGGLAMASVLGLLMFYMVRRRQTAS